MTQKHAIAGERTPIHDLASVSAMHSRFSQDRYCLAVFLPSYVFALSGCTELDNSSPPASISVATPGDVVTKEPLNNTATPRPPIDDPSADSIETLDSQEQAGDSTPSIPIESVRVLSARLVPFSTATGLSTKAVVVKWQNVGDRPVRAFNADVYLLDSRGQNVEVIRDYTIYAVSDDSPGVAHREIYQTPNGDGFIVNPTIAPTARRVRLKVTNVMEKHGAF